MTTIQSSTPWRAKAEREIAKLCFASYVQANRLANGSFRKRHVPYSVPEKAQELVACLATNDEIRAKQIFLYELR